MGGEAVFIDVEYVFDLFYVKKFGVDINNFIVF